MLDRRKVGIRRDQDDDIENSPFNLTLHPMGIELLYEELNRAILKQLE
jgi:hypothetical protein